MTHSRHVGGKIVADVFKVAEEVMRAVWHPSKIDRKVPNLAFVNHPQNPWPRGSVKALVFVEFFGLHADNTSVSFHKKLVGLRRCWLSGFRCLAFTD